jgi:hypothetical protein
MTTLGREKNDDTKEATLWRLFIAVGFQREAVVVTSILEARA